MHFRLDRGTFVPGFNVEKNEEKEVPGFNVGPEDVLAVRGMAPDVADDPDVVPTAVGDLRCQACGAGRASGTTGAYSVGGETLCPKCAVKRLGYEDVPSSELPDLLYRYILRPNSR